MQNSNEEEFKKKYLKYKAKYLELKDLIEGGNTPTDQCKDLDKKKCNNIDNSKKCIWRRGVCLNRN
jgi:hypothetical protein